MPTMRKYTDEEVKDLVGPRRTQRHVIAEFYDTLMAGFDAGDYGEAELDETETKLLVRKRLREAALRRGVDLDFITTANNTVIFKVVEKSQISLFTETPQPEPEQMQEREVSA
jgi:hypothetical protein